MPTPKGFQAFGHVGAVNNEIGGVVVGDNLEDFDQGREVALCRVAAVRFIRSMSRRENRGVYNCSVPKGYFWISSVTLHLLNTYPNVDLP
jgi:hypothetical protein